VSPLSRRRLLGGLGAGLAAIPILGLLPGRSRASGGTARRLVVFYFPDGVPGPSQNGQPSLWHPTGSLTDFRLTDVLSPLAHLKHRCAFINGLTMGPTDSGSHPGGAKKLLTGVDGGGGESVDRYLGRTIGAATPFRHLYLGAMANANNASGDKHISYVTAHQTAPPEDNPLTAFERLFGAAAPAVGGARDLRRSVIDGALAELDAFRGRLSPTDRERLGMHLDALREVERRVLADATPDGSCDAPGLAMDGVDPGRLYEPERFPAILRAQTDLAVAAMACGKTNVAVIQGSHHTSELIMSRFVGSEMHDPGYDMRSHQASHYGAAHDLARREFADFVKQRRWWVAQFAYLLDQLASRPEGETDMLDHTLVLLCTEVCDGNTHLHDNMPFILAGGPVAGGRLHQPWGTRHNALLTAITHLCGAPTTSFGQTGDGPLGGLY
jgi:hypothetical protein